jgi:signal transduction histidine kinase
MAFSLIVVRGDGSIAHANAATRLLLGYVGPEPEGWPIHAVVVGKSYRVLLELARAKPPVETGLSYASHDGRYVKVQLAVALLPTRAGERRLLCVASPMRSFPAGHIFEATAVQPLSGLIIADDLGAIRFVSAEVERVLGYESGELTGQPLEGVVPVCVPGSDTACELPSSRRVQALRKGGQEVALKVGFSVLEVDGQGLVVLGVADRTERESFEGEIRRLSVALAQAEKFAVLGKLASGIVHEISAPAQYVSDNQLFLQRAFTHLTAYLTDVASLLQAEQPVPSVEQLVAVRQSLKEHRIAYLLEQVPEALEQSREGLRRLAAVVHSIGDFAHPSGGQKTLVRLEDAVRGSVAVTRNVWKYVADVTIECDPALPRLLCLRDELNQLVVNLVVNAAHAIEELPGRSSKGRISITARRDGEWAELRVGDTGRGIAQAVLPRVFERFFTTKEAGRGTGQGLAFAWATVVDRHGGEIRVDSTVGQGTTFVVRLPLMGHRASARPERSAVAARQAAGPE